MDVEGIFWTLVVIVFTAIRIFELAGKRKGSKDRQARGAPRYEESDVLRGRGDDRTTAASSRHPRGLESEQSAQVLLPDDLWEILTGERRRPVLTVPAPEPEPDFEFDFEPDSEPEPDLEPEPVRVDAGRYEETRSPVHAREPDIVSLESEPPPAEIRRAAFHDRLGSTPPLARPRAARRLPPLLANRKGLRQAVVLREVLGPPKGLDG